MDKAVFIDRDGVINEMVYFQEHGFVDSPFKASQLELLNGVPKAISILNSLGFKVIIISNQPGIAKGKFSEKEFELIRKKMHKEIKKHGAFVDDEFYCFHHPDSKIKKLKMICSCRKPKTGLMEDAVAKHNIDIQNSYFVGDGIVDMLAAKKMKCKSIFVGTLNSTILKQFKQNNVKPYYAAKDLLEAVSVIKKESQRKIRRYTN
jgi:D-glycero-D-manno-heptose 1,7-bisphosphate phosphatase